MRFTVQKAALVLMASAWGFGCPNTGTGPAQSGPDAVADAGLPNDTALGPNDVSDGGTQDEGAKPPTQSPPGACDLIIDAALGQSTVTGKVVAKVTAGHGEPDKISWRQATWAITKALPPKTPDGLSQDPCGDTAGELIVNPTTVDNLVGEVVDGNSIAQFEVEWDTLADPKPAAGSYCLMIAVTMDNKNPTPSWPANPPPCQAVREFQVDVSGPQIVLDEPQDFVAPLDPSGGVPVGQYMGQMPIRFQADDATGIESIRLLDGNGNVVRSFDVGDGGFMDVDDSIDVCKLGTGLVNFKLEASDALGNTSERSLAPYIIRCPSFVSAQRLDRGSPKVVAKDMAVVSFAGHLASHPGGEATDIPDDDLPDVVAGTADGVFVFLNDGAGGFRRPLRLPDLPGAVLAVIPERLNDDSLTDFIVLHGGGGESWVSVYLAVPDDVCEPDASYSPADLEPGQDPPDLLPVVCHSGFGLAQQFELPVSITGHAYTRFAADTDNLADGIKKDQARDLIIGTDKMSFGVGVFVHSLLKEVSWTDAEGVTVKAPACSYFSPSWDLDGELIEPPEGQHAECFKAPLWSPGLPGAASFAVANFIQDPDLYLDLAVARNKSTVTILQHVGGGKLESGSSLQLDAPVTQVMGGAFSVGNFVDLLVVMPSLGQVRHYYGYGDGSFETAFSEDGQSYLLRRAICVEGEPSFVVQAAMDDFDSAQATADLVVANRATGTLWTLFSAGIGQGYPQRSLVEVLPEPVQVIVHDLNGDGFPDAMVRSATGGLAVVYGAVEAAPGQPANSLLLGKKGTFVGGIAIPTPIPEQSPGGTHVCDKSKQAANGDAFLGTPENRLQPAFVSFNTFDGDDSVDMVVVTEPAPSYLDGFGANRLPVLFYKSDGVMPSEFAAKSEHIEPFTAKCVSQGEDTCEQPYGPPKLLGTDLAAGSFDADFTVDLVYATGTFFNSDDGGVAPNGEPIPPAPELPTLDVLFNKGDGTFTQFSQDSTNPEYSDAPGKWFDLGMKGWSRPRDVATLHCKKPGDFLADYAVLGLREAETTRSRLRVYKGNAGKNFSLGLDYAFLEDVDAKFLAPARLGASADGLVDPTDLLVADDELVRVFTGAKNCTFQLSSEILSFSGGIRGVTAQDLDGNGFADIVVPLTGGQILVAFGIDGLQFQVPNATVSVGDGRDLTQPSIADINGDGFWDVLVLDRSTSNLLVIPGTGQPGVLWKGAAFALQLSPGTISYQAVDMDQDGCLDIGSLSRTAKAIGLHRNAVGRIAPCQTATAPPL